jgi:hypothetical protein
VREPQVTFVMRELDRLKIIQAVVDGDLQPIRAAERLGLTSRQVRRLARRYEREDPIGLTSRRFNRPSNNELVPSLRRRVLGILRELYADFGPTLAADKRRKWCLDIFSSEPARKSDSRAVASISGFRNCLPP